ncbi:hypothetical protein B0H11DRAFT_1935682 [Mycena galericulata]|nr:hypothetical protein B0H11DRAFT_1935682 [Mycena galericulata]
MPEGLQIFDDDDLHQTLKDELGLIRMVTKLNTVQGNGKGISGQNSKIPVLRIIGPGVFSGVLLCLFPSSPPLRVCLFSLSFGLDSNQGPRKELEAAERLYFMMLWLPLARKVWFSFYDQEEDHKTLDDPLLEWPALPLEPFDAVDDVEALAGPKPRRTAFDDLKEGKEALPSLSRSHRRRKHARAANIQKNGHNCVPALSATT